VFAFNGKKISAVVKKLSIVELQLMAEKDGSMHKSRNGAHTLRCQSVVDREGLSAV
jgi:hypothetical protein